MRMFKSINIKMKVSERMMKDHIKKTTINDERHKWGFKGLQPFLNPNATHIRVKKNNFSLNPKS